MTTRTTTMRTLIAACAFASLATGAFAQVATARDTRLAEAASRNDLAAVRRLIADKADVNGAQGDGMTALHWAAQGDDAEMTRALLAAGAKPAAATRLGGITPLLLAATSGNADIVKALLAAGADAKSAKSTGTTALMLASASGHLDTVRALLAAGADVNAREAQNGQTALMFAAAENRGTVIAALAAAGADLNVRSKVVSLATKTRYDDDGNPIKPPTPEQISRTGRGPLSSMGGFTAAHYAARQGHMAAVQALVDAHADVNLVSGSDGTSALLVATANGHFDVARYLLDHGADPNLADESGLAPLYAAVDAEWAPLGWAPNPITGQEKTTHLELMRVLLDKGADPNLRLRKKLWFRSLTHDQHWVTTAGATAFWRAAQASDVPVMKLLATRGADPNIPSIEGTTPLLVAAGVGWGANFHRNLHGAWVEAAAYCLELGLDVNAEDRNHFTAIHGAAYRGDLEMMKLFIAKGAKLDVKSKFGYPTDMANGPKVNAHLPIEQPEAMALLLANGAPAPVMPKADAVKSSAPKQ
jgi:ankyrin repeat protein